VKQKGKVEKIGKKFEDLLAYYINLVEKQNYIEGLVRELKEVFEQTFQAVKMKKKKITEDPVQSQSGKAQEEIQVKFEGN